MEKNEYRIGDMAQMVGISRDTLRFYEKKGIIAAQKKDNGYRYYSDKDIYKMMYVLYQRKMNYSLEEIESMITEGCSCSRLRSYIQQREEKEAEAIRSHQQAIARLRLTRRDLDNIEENLNRCRINTFPQAYLLKRCPSFQEGLKEWFRLSASRKGLDMTYFYTVYAWNGADLEEKETQLLLYQEAARYLDFGGHMSEIPMTEGRKCVYAVVRSGHPGPDRETLTWMQDWAREKGLKPGNTLYSNNIVSFFKEDDLICHLELYLPLEPDC